MLPMWVRVRVLDLLLVVGEKRRRRKKENRKNRIFFFDSVDVVLYVFQRVVLPNIWRLNNCSQL